MLILIQSILGFPQENWDPKVGDSIKPYYYGFFICLALIFLIANMFKKYKFAYFVVPFFVLLSLNILGFPKTEERSYINEIEQVNSFSTFCELNTIIFNDLSNFNISSCDNFEVTKRTEYLEVNNFTEPPRYQRVNIFFMGILFVASIIVSIKEIFLGVKNQKE